MSVSSGKCCSAISRCAVASANFWWFTRSTPISNSVRACRSAPGLAKSIADTDVVDASKAAARNRKDLRIIVASADVDGTTLAAAKCAPLLRHRRCWGRRGRRGCNRRGGGGVGGERLVQGITLIAAVGTQD